MKSLVGMTALTALLIGTNVTSVQAEEVSALWFTQGPQLLLAEGGSERLMLNQQRLQALANQRSASDDGQRFVQLIEEQPTAAGDAASKQQFERKAAPSFKSPIQRDRELYGSPH